MSTKTKTLFAAAALLLFTVPATLAVVSPTPTTNYWMSRVNPTHSNPRDMTVIIVPPAYFSYSAMVQNPGWVGPDALADQPGTRAALEATNYWLWAINEYAGTHPVFAYIDYDTKVLGVDATPADLQTADIIVNTAMVEDFIPFIFHLGLGLPTLYPWGVIFSSPGDQWMSKCTVWNTGLGSNSFDVEPIRLRNLVVHEFGHCLGAGHSGESLGAAHCDSNNVCYANHGTDVMSQVFGTVRQCLSNLNMLSLAEGYDWLTSSTATWAPHDPEVYQLKTAYATTCLPTSEYKF